MPAKVQVAFCVSVVLAAAASANLFTDPELRRYRLTTETLARVIDATKAMRAEAQRSAEFRKEAQTQHPVTASLRAAIEGIAATRPLHVKIIQANGLSVEDYFLTFFAVFQVQQVEARGENWMAIRKCTNPANRAFVRQHAQQVQRLTEEISALDAIKEHHS